MNGITTTAAILMALAAYTLLAPGRADPVNTSVPAGCTADGNCSESAPAGPGTRDR